MRGRKPKPTAIKIAEGNPGKKALNREEPRPEIGAPPCPDYLAGHARDKWDELVPSLVSTGVLAFIDGTALARYCVAYQVWRDAVEEIKRDGTTYVTEKGNTVARPTVGIVNTQAAILAKLEAEFGLTPSARARIKATPPTAPEQELEDFLSAGGLKIAE
jgi:P27 family predicted phage terminase small subunit